MEWSHDLSLQLIELYREHRCLWDPNYGNYKNNSKKEDAWKDIGKAMNCEAIEVRKKMDSLLASYRRERQKSLICKSENGSKKMYKSKWFAYRTMQFLQDKYRPKYITSNSITNIIEQNNVAEDTIEENYNVNQQSNLEFPLENQHCKRKLESPWIEQMYSALKDTIFNRVSKDECAIFAEHIAVKLRTYSNLTRNAVEHQINNILYEADIGKFENQYKPSTSTQTQK